MLEKTVLQMKLDAYLEKTVDTMKSYGYTIKRLGDDDKYKYITHTRAVDILNIKTFQDCIDMVMDFSGDRPIGVPVDTMYLIMFQMKKDAEAQKSDISSS